MSEQRTLADVLERLVAIAASITDGGQPLADDGDCVFCLVNLEERGEHDPDCGYGLAKKLSYADRDEVRRLARVLRYGEPAGCALERSSTPGGCAR